MLRFIASVNYDTRGGTAKLYLLELDRTVILFNVVLTRERRRRKSGAAASYASEFVWVTNPTRT